MRRSLSAVVVAFLLTSCRTFLMGQSPDRTAANPPQRYTFEIAQAFPHDASAYTQGLAYHGGFLYEGTGRNGQSSLRKVRLETGEVVHQVNLGPEFFGEGITIVKDKVYQLTWKSGLGLVYDLNSFRLLQKFSYPGEGWGLATDGRELFLSDGTSEIRVLDPENFQEKRRLKVHDGTTRVDQLNEL
jgi:glutamine cyclotransferase